MSPTARTLKALRDQGMVVDVAEHWNHFTKRRHDLFGWIDCVALDGHDIIGVQCCARSGHAARRKKILASDTALPWLKSGGRIQVISWAKKLVGKQIRWNSKVEEITSERFA
jgi:hypothetical protein